MRALSILAFFALSFSATGFAEDLPVPSLRGPVEDLAHVLSSSEAAALTTRLLQLRANGGPQFQLLTVPTLNGEPIEHFSIRVFDQWKLGDTKRDDGLLLLIALNDRKMRIEVGQGLEGQIPDITASRTIREILRPSFRDQAFAAGIETAMARLAEAAGHAWPQGGPSYQYAQTANQVPKGFVLIKLIGTILLLLFLFGSPFGRLFLAVALSGRGGGGGGWSGGGGGGGWSGGGGSSSGGGSSGSW